MGKAKKTRKFAAVKRMLNPADPRLSVLLLLDDSLVWLGHAELTRLAFCAHIRPNRKANAEKEFKKKQEEKEAEKRVV